MDPFTPVLFLTIGAVAVVIGSNRSYGIYGITALVSIAGAIVVTLLLGFRLPTTVILSPWQIANVFPNSLSLTVDRVSWFLALLLVMATMSLLLTGVADRLEMSSAERAVCLVVIALALLVLFSDNLLTLVLALTLSDIFSSLFVFVSNRKNNLSQDFARNLHVPEMVRLCTKLFSIGLVLLIALDDYTLLHTSNKVLSIGQASILIIAAMIRLNIYPVNVGLVLNNAVSRVLITVIYLVNIVVVVHIFASFGLQSYVINLRGWLTVAAILSGLVGGYRWCIAINYSERLYSLVLAQSGLAVLAFLWGGNWAVVGALSHVIAIVLSSVVVYIGKSIVGSDGNSFVRVSLTGLVFGCQPLTAGFLGVFVMYSGLMSNLSWAIIVIPSIIVINCLTILGGFRLLQLTIVDIETQQSMANVAKTIGICLPLLASVAVGLMPDKFASVVGLPILPNWSSLSTISGLTTLGTSAISASLAIFFWYYRSEVLSVVKDMSGSSVLYVTDLKWIYLTIWRTYRSFEKSIHMLTDILEGQGGVLWALVIVFAMLLVVGG